MQCYWGAPIKSIIENKLMIKSANYIKIKQIFTKIDFKLAKVGTLKICE